MEAREWVDEQDGKIREAERIRAVRENKLIRYTFWTLIAAIVAAVAAIVIPIALPLIH